MSWLKFIIFDWSRVDVSKDYSDENTFIGTEYYSIVQFFVNNLTRIL